MDFVSVSVQDELRLRRVQSEGTKWHERIESRSLSCTLESASPFVECEGTSVSEY